MLAFYLYPPTRVDDPHLSSKMSLEKQQLLQQQQQSHEQAALLIRSMPSNSPITLSRIRTIQNVTQSFQRNKEKLKRYKRRWFVLGVFMSHMISNNMVWISFSPISTIAQCYYGVSLFWINALSWVYMLTYALFSLPAVWFLEKGGLKWTGLIGATLNAAGSWLRFAGTRMYVHVCMHWNIV